MNEQEKQRLESLSKQKLFTENEQVMERLVRKWNKQRKEATKYVIKKVYGETSMYWKEGKTFLTYYIRLGNQTFIVATVERNEGNGWLATIKTADGDLKGKFYDAPEDKDGKDSLIIAKNWVESECKEEPSYAPYVPIFPDPIFPTPDPFEPPPWKPWRPTPYPWENPWGPWPKVPMVGDDPYLERTTITSDHTEALPGMGNGYGNRTRDITEPAPPGANDNPFGFGPPREYSQ